MGRTAKDKREQYYAPPIQKVEVSGKHLKPRLVAAVAFLIIGVTALAFAFSAFTSVGSGWQEIEASGDQAACAGEFTLLYELGASGVSARTENRGVSGYFTQAAVTAYRAFNADETFEGVGNLRTLTENPNAEVRVDPVLWDALALLERYGDRTIFLGPALQIYDNVFTCQQDWQLADFDPQCSQELRQLFTQIVRYAGDPEQARIELPGEGRAVLRVSEEYLDFLRREELDNTLDLGWMKNAFAVDYIADTLAQAGYTRGSLSSVDGYARNLDEVSGSSYDLPVYDRQGTDFYQAAELRYTGALAAVSYRDFPVTREDSWRYYVTEDGEIRNRYLSLTDGLPHTAARSLTVYSRTLGCAETMLMTAPLFTGETLTEAALAPLPAKGVEAIWPQDATVWTTDPQADIAAAQGLQLRILTLGS